MLLGILRKVLSEDKKALLDLALRMVAALDTPEERKKAAQQGIKMFELLKLMVLKHESRVTAHLSPEERRQLLNLLSQLTHERD